MVECSSSRGVWEAPGANAPVVDEVPPCRDALVLEASDGQPQHIDHIGDFSAGVRDLNSDIRRRIL